MKDFNILIMLSALVVVAIGFRIYLRKPVIVEPVPVVQELASESMTVAINKGDCGKGCACRKDGMCQCSAKMGVCKCGDNA